MINIIQAGDSCLFVEFGHTIDVRTNVKVHQLKNSLQRNPLENVKELVPTYRSLAIYFDPLTTDLQTFKADLLQRSNLANAEPADSPTQIRLPVCYDAPFAPDLQDVAAHANLTPREIILRHSRTPVYCFMNGFSPGFAYLGGMDPTLTTPRLKTPREQIPAGSVAIGGNQTGIYPSPTPGGWRIIGRTPVKLYDPQRTPIIAIPAGIWVQFHPIDPSEYQKIETQTSEGTYQLDIAPKEGVSP